MIMALRWIFKRLAHDAWTSGMWGYLTSRDQNKSRIELERVRIEGTKGLIDHLPNGAVYREGTPSGWREIQMPAASPPPLFVLPVEQQKSAEGSSEAAKLLHSPMALGQGEESGSGVVQQGPRPGLPVVGG